MAVLKNIARSEGAGPLMVIDTEVVGAQRSKPEYSFFMSSSVAMLTPLVPTLPQMSGRLSGSRPYNVTLSKAVDRRLAGRPRLTRWNRLLVRSGVPSPANIRVGSSPSRLSGNTPAVKGKWPGRFSNSA